MRCRGSRSLDYTLFLKMKAILYIFSSKNNLVGVITVCTSYMCVCGFPSLRVVFGLCCEWTVCSCRFQVRWICRIKSITQGFSPPCGPAASASVTAVSTGPTHRPQLQVSASSHFTPQFGFPACMCLI